MRQDKLEINSKKEDISEHNRQLPATTSREHMKTNQENIILPNSRKESDQDSLSPAGRGRSRSRRTGKKIEK